MKPLLLAILILVALSCNKENNTDCCMNISLDTNISLKTAASKDLLNPENPNAFKKENIKTYYLIEGVQKRAGSNDIIYQDEDGLYKYRTFVNSEENNELTETYIDWNETDRDTITSKIYRTENQIRVIKVWYNQKLMWDAENGTPNEFTILK